MPAAASEAMPSSLAGRRVLVTGASRGIGAEIAVVMGSRGAVVGVHYNRSAAEAAAVARKIVDAGGAAHLLQGDLYSPDVGTALVDQFVEAAGGIDVLVNNAGGVERYVHFLEMTDKDWDRALSFNATAPMRLAVSAFRRMSAAGFGRIINIGTTAVKYNGPNSIHYVAAKAAMESVSSALAREGAAKNVTVNTVRCGLIDTGMRESISGYSDEAYQKRLALVPVGRAGLPSEVAALVAFLASDEAAFITREIWAVAGGD